MAWAIEKIYIEKNIWLYVNRSRVNSINQKNSKKFKRIWHVNKKSKREKNKEPNDYPKWLTELFTTQSMTSEHTERRRKKKVTKERRSAKKLSKLIIFGLFSFAFGVLVKKSCPKSPSATKPCINQHTQLVQRMKFKMVPNTQHKIWLTHCCHEDYDDRHLSFEFCVGQMAPNRISTEKWTKKSCVSFGSKSILLIDWFCVSACVCEKVEFEFSTPLHTIPISSDKQLHCTSSAFFPHFSLFLSSHTDLSIVYFLVAQSQKLFILLLVVARLCGDDCVVPIRCGQSEKEIEIFSALCYTFRAVDRAASDMPEQFS